MRSEEILWAQTGETGDLIDAGAVVSARIRLAFVHFRRTTFAVVTCSGTIAAKASLVVRLTRSVVLTRNRTAGQVLTNRPGEIRRALARIIVAVRSTFAVVQARRVRRADVSLLAEFPGEILRTFAVKRADSIVTGAVVLARRNVRAETTFVHVDLAAIAGPLSRTETFRLPVDQTLARAVLLAIQRRAGVVFAARTGKARRTSTFAQRLFDVQINAFQPTFAVVSTAVAQTETRLVQRFRTVPIDETFRAVARVAVDQIDARGAVEARR